MLQFGEFLSAGPLVVHCNQIFTLADVALWYIQSLISDVMVSKAIVDDLGKPVAEWKTTLARACGGLAFIGGALLTGFGAAKIVSGCRVASPNYFSLCTKIVGSGMVAIGLPASFVGAAVWDSATSARATRKYIELAQKLNERSAPAVIPSGSDPLAVLAEQAGRAYGLFAKAQEASRSSPGSEKQIGHLRQESERLEALLQQRLMDYANKHVIDPNAGGTESLSVYLHKEAGAIGQFCEKYHQIYQSAVRQAVASKVIS